MKRRRSGLLGPASESHLRVVREADEALPAAPSPTARRTPVRLTLLRPGSPSVLMPAPEAFPELDFPGPGGPETHLEAAIHHLRLSAQSLTISQVGDGLLHGIDHAARALGEVFDREVAKAHLQAIIDSL